MTRQIGDLVIVHNKDHTYDNYHAWPDRVQHVPNFEYGASPLDGQRYTITYIGQHEYPGHSDLYVLDGRFIVGERAFVERA